MQPRMSTAAAAVIGAAHRRGSRNGQDAVAVWSEAGRGVAVVCDGCGSAPRSELGALAVAQSLTAALARQVRAGVDVADPAVWMRAREQVVALLRALLASWRLGDLDERGDAGVVAATAAQPAGDVAAALEQEQLRQLERHLLCTAVAVAVSADTVAVWAIGDGAYVLDGELRVLGPFADNAPPYLAYDLLARAPQAQLATTPRRVDGAVLIATDGAAALGGQLCEIAADARYTDRPDALRRHLAVLARPTERILWHEQRIERVAAPLHDDAAVAVLRWGPR